jgi:hypothetical protein
MDLSKPAGKMPPQAALPLSSMKKTTKTDKTPAPAPKPAPAKKAVTPVAAPAPAVKSTVAPKIKAPAAAAPAVVAKPKGARVTIVAAIDVGFGNAVHVRGDEPPLGWGKGHLLGYTAEGKWEIVLTGITAPFEFKFLVNDTSWSTGENYCASPGDTLTITPSF